MTTVDGGRNGQPPVKRVGPRGSPQTQDSHQEHITETGRVVIERNCSQVGPLIRRGRVKRQPFEDET